MEGLTKTELLKRFAASGVSPSKALGQSFLVDSNLAERIARTSVPGEPTRLIEIGPGAGALTIAIAPKAISVLAIEVDRYIVPVLSDVLSERGVSNVSVLRQDVMDFKWVAELVPGEHYTVAANLPYNISATLIVRILEEVPAIDRLVVMVQEEVGRRIAAKPGTKDYSSVSVKVSYWAEAKLLFSVAPTVFYPRPNVNSAVIEIERRGTMPAVPDGMYDVFSALVRSGFTSRRQMMRRSLAKLADGSLLESLGIDPTRRAETLSHEDFRRIAEAIIAKDLPVTNTGD